MKTTKGELKAGTSKQTMAAVKRKNYINSKYIPQICFRYITIYTEFDLFHMQYLHYAATLTDKESNEQQIKKDMSAAT